MTSMTVIEWPLWLKKLKLPTEMLIVFCQKEKYQSLVAGIFAHKSASTVHMISMTLEDSHCFSLLIKL